MRFNSAWRRPASFLPARALLPFNAAAPCYAQLRAPPLARMQQVPGGSMQCRALRRRAAQNAVQAGSCLRQSLLLLSLSLEV